MTLISNKPSYDESAFKFCNYVENFFDDIRQITDYKQRLPNNRIPTLNKLTKIAYVLFNQHPIFNLIAAKPMHARMKKDYAEATQTIHQSRIKLLSLPVIPVAQRKGFDHDALIRSCEKQLALLQQAIADMDNLIRFQEDQTKPLSENYQYPLIEATQSFLRLVKSALFHS